MDALLYHDEYLLLADYQSYMDCQEEVGRAYRDPKHWTRMSILNVARMGKFSSDRAIREYCADIWNVPPLSVELWEEADMEARLKLGPGEQKTSRREA